MTKRLGFALSLLLSALAWGAGVDGKWTGQLTLDSGETVPASIRLKQDGSAVTGTQGPSDQKQFPITKGRIEGEQVTIEAQPGASVLRLSMKRDGNKLAGDVYEDGHKIGTVSLQKANP